MSSPTIIDLKPSELLINSDFDGYKLSLDPIPVLKAPLTTEPQRIFTNDDQYTFLHAKLFSLHNHLFRDPWLSNSGYFLDDSHIIRNVRYDESTGKLTPITAVHKISKWTAAKDPYNASICFVSERHCVFSEGCGDLRLFDTSDRYRNDEWKTIYAGDIFNDRHPFIVQDARWETIDGTSQIHCLLLSVQRKEEAGNEKFHAVIDWVVLRKEANDWIKHHVRQLKGNALPEYCQLEPKCNALLISADAPFQFTFDADNAIDVKADVKITSEEQVKDGTEKFVWNQAAEDVYIHFNTPRDTAKQNVKVVCDGDKLQVWLKEELLLDANLLQEVDNELTTWNLGNEILQITLVKRMPDIEWSSLFKDHIVPPGELIAQPIRELALPPAHIRTEMEDCDFGEVDCDREYTFVRLNAATHKTTHLGNLGSSNGVLFNLGLRANSPLAFVLRSDVDAIVWQPTTSVTADGELNFAVRHEGTLNAIAYVQASKQQKKFIQCSPDMSYAIICEPRRHIFYYKGSYDTAGGLRNRNSAANISIGQQKLVTLDGSDEVLGILCENNVTILLTQKQILCLQL